MKYDYTTLYNKSAAFYEARPALKKALKLVNPILTLLFIGAYLGLWAYGIFFHDFAPMEYVKLFFVPMLALLLVSVLRLAVDRPRPYSAKGAGIIPLVKRIGGDTDSFPSRHVTCASVIAMTFLAHFTWLGILLFALCLILAYARFAAGVHYPSDLIAGIVLGVGIGCFMFIL